MTLGKTIWSNGRSLQVEYPERGTIEYQGFSAIYRGNVAKPNLFYFSIPTPVDISDKRQVGTISLRFRSSEGAFVESIEIYDGERKIDGKDKLHVRHTQWNTKKIDLPMFQEIHWGLGVSVLVNFASDVQWIEFSAVGADFFSDDYSDNIFNVRCFGAKGDGHDDSTDSEAIRNAISAIRKTPNATGILKFPNGTYKVNSKAFNDIHGLNGLVIEGTTISELLGQGTTIQYTGKDKAMLFFEDNEERNLYFSIRDIKIQGLPGAGHLLHTKENVSLSWLEINRVVLSHSNPKSSLVVMEDTYAAHMSFRNIIAWLGKGAEEVAFNIKGKRWFQLEFDNMKINMPKNVTKPAINLENTAPGGETAAGTSLRRITFQGTRAGAVRVRGVQYIFFEHVGTGDYEDIPIRPAFDIDAYMYPDPNDAKKRRANTARRITFMNCVSTSGTEENPDIQVGNRHPNEAPVLINCRIGYLDVQGGLGRSIIGRPIIIGASNYRANLVGDTFPLHI
ncbi:MAG: hypothetical protein F6J95_029155 [Leptolyngbya sp. SIO1E4]|nr:hypothetical protein [Leptolyngbya sp. SIO1E4]